MRFAISRRSLPVSLNFFFNEKGLVSFLVPEVNQQLNFAEAELESKRNIVDKNEQYEKKYLKKLNKMVCFIIDLI